jgi:dipeptidase
MKANISTSKLYSISKTYPMIKKGPFRVYKILLGILILLSINSAHAQTSAPEHAGGSFMILCGSNITEDGSTLVAQNHTGNRENPYYLTKYPRTKYDSSGIIRFSNGLEISQTNITQQWLSLQKGRSYKDSRAIGINENQVALAGWVSLSHDRNSQARKADPFVRQGAPEAIVPVALERARNAREFVKILGDFYNRYGITSAVGIAVADKKEVWYMETAGGRHWAAIRIPDDACWIQANGYRIGQINPNDRNVMTSPGIRTFASENGLYDPEGEFFDFAEVFGGRTQKMEQTRHYNTRRLWRAISMLAPSLEIKEDQQEFPLFIKPGEKISLQQLMDILRDHYQDTPYNTLTSDSVAEKEQPIASRETVHSTIIQLTNGLPANVGAVMWTGLGNPNSTPYIPFYFGVSPVPEPYNKKTRDDLKAYQVYRKLSDAFHNDPRSYSNTFPGVYQAYQEKALREQVEIDRGAMRLYRMDARMAIHFLTVNVESLSQQALDIARAQLEQMEE